MGILPRRRRITTPSHYDGSGLITAISNVFTAEGPDIGTPPASRQL